MAIPIILGVAAAAAAATGLYKGGKAVVDNNKASDVNDDAKRIASNAERNMECAREACQSALTNLGQRKVDTLSVNVNDFLTTFKQIKNVDFQHNGDFGNLNANEFSDIVLQEMSASVNFVISSGLGAGGGSIGGALTAYGAYSGVMALGTASTGTAIGTLSGAAATNATLAWLGGGSLAAGGGGMALGSMVLAGAAAGPALLIAGWYMGSKAESNLNDAYSNKAQAEKFAADIDAAVSLTYGIQQVAIKAADILSELRKYSRRNLVDLKNILTEQGVDYAQYNEEAKLSVMKNVKIIQTIKAVLDTPILDEEGSLLGDTENRLADIQQHISSGFKN